MKNRLIRSNYLPYNIYFHGTFMPPPESGCGLIYYQNRIYKVFLSARHAVCLDTSLGHNAMYFTCIHCTYSGYANIQRVKGTYYYVWGIATLGIGMCFKSSMDTYHFCPQCNVCLGYAKVM